ncbi:MAG: hypothetical protein ACR2LI_12845, partial [Propionibacteriaceae bacterium]
MIAADQPTTGESPETGVSGSRHLGGAARAAAWGFVFLILRIFAVSNYDWSTAFAVSTTLGLDDGLALLFGSLMAGHLLTAILLIAVLPLLIAARVWGPRGHRPVATLLATIGLVTLGAITVSFGSWWLPLATLVVFAAIALIRRLPGQSPIRRASSHALARVGWVAGVAVLVVAAFVSTPWV